MHDEINALAKQIIDKSTAQRLTIGTAESCTGGLIGAALTTISGSSKSYLGGLIVYSNGLKGKLLNIPPGMIHKYGAVSRHVARVMAKNTIEALNVDLAVSVTGIAGPGGGRMNKPIGTVYIGLATRTKNEVETKVKPHSFGDLGRGKVREMACLEALKMLNGALTR